jgi:biopolymer transport protein ExbD
VKISTNLKILEGNYNYIPFISVFFLLLIFLMLNSSFVQVSSINIELPPLPGQPVSAEKLVVTIDKNQNYYFNDQVMDLKTIKEQLANIVSKYQVDSIILRADQNTPQGAVAKILSLANSLNLIVYLAVDSSNSSTYQVPFEKTN